MQQSGSPRMTRRRSHTDLLARTAFAVGCALLVCACNTDQQVAGVPDVAPDYRMRHPITIKESARTIELFIGSNRNTLDPDQRAQLLEFAQAWREEATGGVIIDLPTGSTNARAAAEAMPEIRSILTASGVPPRGIVVRKYPASGMALGVVRVNYPKITAQAGPCGIWPEDIGPSFNRDYFENQEYWNFGCANQRNLAAMVEDPADLVEPRAETPAYTPRRNVVIDKYRQGQDTATQRQTSTAGRITDLGQ
jgi:pilus assembly protein CpaD